VVVGAATDIGFVRRDNEDSYGVFSEGARGRHRLFVVADGMGGYERGAEASALAVDVVRNVYFASERSQEERLKAAFAAANRAVYERSRLLGVRMGTTCTALSCDVYPIIAHIGDSRAYRISRESVELVTDDHTFVGELKAQGMLSESEAAVHPRRHALTRTLGLTPEAVPSIERMPDEVGTIWYVLCTDGIRSVDSYRLASLVRRLEPQQACEALIGEANQSGGTDNSTAVVVRFG
jgi:protein phosphatase